MKANPQRRLFLLGSAALAGSLHASWSQAGMLAAANPPRPLFVYDGRYCHAPIFAAQHTGPVIPPFCLGEDVLTQVAAILGGSGAVAGITTYADFTVLAHAAGATGRTLLFHAYYSVQPGSAGPQVSYRVLGNAARSTATAGVCQAAAWEDHLAQRLMSAPGSVIARSTRPGCTLHAWRFTSAVQRA